MKDHTITELTSIVKDSFGTYDAQGTTHWTWQTAAQDLQYQMGSLTKIILQMTNYRWADGKDKDTLMAEFSDELSDILAEVLYIASELNIDMNEAMAAMVKSDQKKVSERT
ncbi:MAG TPA: hypothetical protein VK674_04935 [Candidatus Limnocylindria bacterium]|nr:hypothetical protein [Candidatus Limnocylindria bacterium]